MIAKRRQKFFLIDQWKSDIKKEIIWCIKMCLDMKSLKSNQVDISSHLDKHKLFQSAEVNFSFDLAYNKQVLRLGKES